MSQATTEKNFDVWMAPKSYRYKEEAIVNHAPQYTGIYMLATFDDQGNGKYLYIGLTLDKTIHEALWEHWKGEREPKAQELLAKYPNLYFGLIVEVTADSDEDWQDLYWAMLQKEKPELMDISKVQNTRRYSQVTYTEKSLLG